MDPLFIYPASAYLRSFPMRTACPLLPRDLLEGLRKLLDKGLRFNWNGYTKLSFLNPLIFSVHFSITIP